MNSWSKLQALLRVCVVVSVIVLGAFTTTNTWAFSASPLTASQGQSCRYGASASRASPQCSTANSTSAKVSHHASAEDTDSTSANQILLAAPSTLHLSSTEVGSNSPADAKDPSGSADKDGSGSSAKDKDSTNGSSKNGSSPASKNQVTSTSGSGSIANGAATSSTTTNSTSSQTVNSSESSEGESVATQSTETSSGKEISSSGNNSGEGTPEVEEDESSEQDDSEDKGESTTSEVFEGEIVPITESASMLAGKVTSLNEATDTFVVNNSRVQISETAENGIELENGDVVTLAGTFQNGVFVASGILSVTGTTTTNNVQ
ncbi:MAG: hypothetical protein P4L50_05255 [Anaerolineaceae bacterium]|nr:hypothetical protein [Anaerolineaceae bacterium]